MLREPLAEFQVIILYGEILPADMADFASILFQYFSSSNINIGAKN